MTLFPRVQKRAQAELDKIVGPKRLPCFEDLHQLPYIRAIVLETVRWIPVVPFGVPHVAGADDSYDGYHIPAGTMLIAVSIGSFQVLSSC